MMLAGVLRVRERDSGQPEEERHRPSVKLIPLFIFVYSGGELRPLRAGIPMEDHH